MSTRNIFAVITLLLAAGAAAFITFELLTDTQAPEDSAADSLLYTTTRPDVSGGFGTESELGRVVSNNVGPADEGGGFRYCNGGFTDYVNPTTGDVVPALTCLVKTNAATDASATFFPYRYVCEGYREVCLENEVGNVRFETPRELTTSVFDTDVPCGHTVQIDICNQDAPTGVACGAGVAAWVVFHTPECPAEETVVGSQVVCQDPGQAAIPLPGVRVQYRASNGGLETLTTDVNGYSESRGDFPTANWQIQIAEMPANLTVPGTGQPYSELKLADTNCELCDGTGADLSEFPVCTESAGPAGFTGEFGNCRIESGSTANSAIFQLTNCSPTAVTGSCGDVCVTDDECPNNHTCGSSGFCELLECATGGADCTPDNCSVITGPPGTCGGPCTTSTDCPNGHTCSGGICELTECADGSATCTTDNCSIITNTPPIQTGGSLPATDLSADEVYRLTFGVLIAILGFVIYRLQIFQEAGSAFANVRANMRANKNSKYGDGVLDDFE